MEVTLNIKRYDPKTNGKGSTQDYTLEIAEDATLLDALLQIREEQDPSLAFRGSCRTGFCGDCTMTVNGKGAVTCRTMVGKTAKKADDGVIPIAPLNLAKVSKDLVYDAEAFHWNKLKAVEPWIDPVEPPAQGEHLVPNGRIEELRTSMACTQCGLCDQGCVVIIVDKTYVGPAALNKAYRVVHDPRDSRSGERLEKLSLKRGMWDCAHCFEASEHCPKFIDPTDRIFDLHDKAIKAGAGPKSVKNHYKSFAASVKADGWLDEARLALETEGLTNVKGLIKLLPLAIKAGMKGKRPMPYFLHHKRPDADKIKKIFEKWEGKGK
jgi:succinate dehydrogenase / fumarate reductase iron-sulfur subunit